MLRWIDLIGLGGFAAVVLSTLLLFPGSAEPMNWMHWLAGLALWLLGFNSVVIWLLLRWSVRPFKDGPPPLLVWSVRKSQQRRVISEVEATHLRTDKVA